MALLRTLQLPSGINIPNVYSRVENFSGSKDSVTFTLANYASRDSAYSGTVPISQSIYGYTLQVQNSDLYTQFYNYLKTLPEFEFAVDVID
ncbi:hypothetical protein ACTFRP_08025 [Bacillus cereus group sp. MYBK234-1]|uniref:hypothetical protein n=1 Tax=unclassified Bacillus cereus group TaxID=2750818 RepID=UPI003F78C4C5